MMCSTKIYLPKIDIFIPRHTIGAGYYGFTLDFVSIRPSVSHTSVRFSFPDDNLKNIDGFSPNLVCALILWKSGLGLLMAKFRQIICPPHDNGGVL